MRKRTFRAVTPSTSPPSGRESATRIKGIFQSIAPRYDLVNALSSLGLDRRWRRAAVRLAELPTGSRALDLAAGTGELTLALAKMGEPALLVSTDFVPRMLTQAQRKMERYQGLTRVVFDLADAERLPFKGESFDAVTIGFGVRNLAHRDQNFREVHRVLKPGGRYVILEFAQPPFAPFRAAYHTYLATVVPLWGGLLARDPRAYRYLRDSIRATLDPEEMARELREAGFTRVEWQGLTSGIVTVHRAVK
jgi:demethylmenaquinone methyltransferase/2-methoxy-6-polyprenyl-1,4-benzoquinol methylase